MLSAQWSAGGLSARLLSQSENPTQYQRPLLSLCSLSCRSDFCLYCWANLPCLLYCPGIKNDRQHCLLYICHDVCLKRAHIISFFSFQMCGFCSTMTIFSGKVQQSKSLLGFKNIFSTSIREMLLLRSSWNQSCVIFVFLFFLNKWKRI